MHDRNDGDPQPGVLRSFQTRDQTRMFYDKISRVYDLLAEHSEAPVRRKGLALLAAGAGESVLEIGCGTGGCLADLAEAVGSTGSVHGIDLSPGMIEQARKRLRGLRVSEQVRLEVADATSLPVEDSRLDAIFLSFTLELFDTPEIPQVLGECLRVLRTGGRIVVVGLSRDAKEDPMLRLYEWTHLHFPNFVDCRPIYVRRALESAGFDIVEAQRDHMWVPVEIVLGRKPPGV